MLHSFLNVRQRTNEVQLFVPETPNCGGDGVMNTYAWHESYKAALLETDWTRLHDRVQAALHEIRERMHVLSENHAGTPEEKQAIEDALSSLKTLGNEAVKWHVRQSDVPRSSSTV